MPKIARQKLGMLLAGGLDLLALGLFFVQAAVDDVDWIKDEFADFQFWDSISDLALLDVSKGVFLIFVYVLFGMTHLAPCLASAILLNVAAVIKVIVFIVHAVRTKSKLPGLHFALPIFVCAIGWIQLAICRFSRNLDLRQLIEQADQDTSSLGDHMSIQTDFPAFRSATAIVAPRRRRGYRETEPLLSGDSLSNSVPITVMPSVPLHPPTLAKLANGSTKPTDSIGSRPTAESSSMPPHDELAAQMFLSMPRKTHIRSLKQISDAFTLQDITTWLKQAFPEADSSRQLVEAFVQYLLDSKSIEDATASEGVLKKTNLDGILLQFSMEFKERMMKESP